MQIPLLLLLAAAGSSSSPRTGKKLLPNRFSEPIFPPNSTEEQDRPTTKFSEPVFVESLVDNLVENLVEEGEVPALEPASDDILDSELLDPVEPAGGTPVDLSQLRPAGQGSGGRPLNIDLSSLLTLLGLGSGAGQGARPGGITPGGAGGSPTTAGGGAAGVGSGVGLLTSGGSSGGPAAGGGAGRPPFSTLIVHLTICDRTRQQNLPSSPDTKQASTIANTGHMDKTRDVSGKELIREWRRYALAVSEAAARWALYFGPHLAGLDPLGVVGFQWMVGLGADIVRAPAEGSLVSPLAMLELIREWRRYALAVSEAAARWALYFGPHLAGLDPLGVVGFQWMVGLGADVVRAPADGSLASPLGILVRPPMPHQAVTLVGSSARKLYDMERRLRAAGEREALLEARLGREAAALSAVSQQLEAAEALSASREVELAALRRQLEEASLATAAAEGTAAELRVRLRRLWRTMEPVADEARAAAAPAEPFSPARLCDQRGRLVWVPEVVLGVDLRDLQKPEFEAAVSSRVGELQAQLHADRHTQDQNMTRVVAECAAVLREHGAGYVRWARDETSAAPFQLLRAALRTPAPFVDLPAGVRGSLLALLQNAFSAIKRERSAVQQMVRDLQGQLGAGAAREAALATQLADSHTAIGDLHCQLQAGAAREAALAAQLADSQAAAGALRAQLEGQTPSDALRTQLEEGQTPAGALRSKLEEGQTSSTLQSQLEEGQISGAICTLLEEGQTPAGALSTQLEEGQSPSDAPRNPLEEASATIQALREEAERSATEAAQLKDQLLSRPNIDARVLRRIFTLALTGPFNSRLRRDIRRSLAKIGDGKQAE
ncbi:hypothetical protein FJT64_000760 [Amphibalanus amphitrite]|uniref:Uncharacterized protein n=1 Tax=Amphibalanus amphitrite TaxID=1232801 RepID=A0A6A4VS25_AMPAM|nr:hypothetical protein FJT64_000760 [Amphibalanus amphitrite]